MLRPIVGRYQQPHYGNGVFSNVYLSRAVARSEIPGGLVVLGGYNVSPRVEIVLADLPNIGGGG
jgi:hypothetical protein